MGDVALSLPRKITYITGTRADFGLMKNCLHALARHPQISLDLLVTGMHLSSQHGLTVNEIVDARLPILAQIPVKLSPATGETMALALGEMVSGFTQALSQNRPDILLLLGDRGEMLAGALVALNLGIPVAHIHGGERSGTIDESIRHAISKLAHLHLVATEESRNRLIAMGEQAERVVCTGAPGLDGLLELPNTGRQEFCNKHGLNPDSSIAVIVFHPVVQQSALVAEQTRKLLDTLLKLNLQSVVMLPNSDAGSDEIRNIWESVRSQPGFVLFNHLPRSDFASLMSWADILVGNSSAGIIEAASFGIPVVNIGSRQNLRERNANVTDVSVEHVSQHLGPVMQALLKQGKFSPHNCYGDGHASQRIVQALLNLSLDPSILEKANAY